MNLEHKKLLILGANPETTSLVQQANRMGIQTVVTDYYPTSQAKGFAWKKYDVDAADVDQVLQIAKKEKIDGVLLGVAEALMPSYLEICKLLDLPCYGTPEQFEVFSNKDQFKALCREYEVPVVEQYDYTSEGDKADFSEISFPVVVKPIDSCSSKGISVCRNETELDVGIAKAMKFSRSKRLLIEKYMTGDEVVIYYTLQDGEVIFSAMCDRYTNKDQHGVAQLPTAYIYPSRYIDTYEQTINDKVIRMLKSFGLKNGTLFIQSFIENGQVRFYEPGYRLNGAQEHLIVSRESGINALELMIHFALTGRMSDLDLRTVANPHGNHLCCKLSPLVRTGRIAKLEGLEKIASLPEVVSVNPSYALGEEVTGYGTLKQIVSRFYIISETKKHLSSTIDEIYSLLVVRDEDNRDMLLKPFDTTIVQENY